MRCDVMGKVSEGIDSNFSYTVWKENAVLSKLTFAHDPTYVEVV